MKKKNYPYLKLKGVLAERGLTQKYLADLLGTSVVVINYKINGHREFTYGEVEAICDALEISTEVFRRRTVS